MAIICFVPAVLFPALPCSRWPICRCMPTVVGRARGRGYAAVLASIGTVELAVTTNLNINFLRKPGQRDMIGEARILKLGKRLAVGEVTLFSEGETDLAAHATTTYSLTT